MKNLNIFDIQRFSLDDGPGIRTTVFFKGCPLSCMWCHNPEGIETGVELIYYDKKCSGCKTCQSVCENDAHIFENGIHIIDRGKCTLCMNCVESCPNDALVKVGEKIDLEALLEEIFRDKIYYDQSGGGITFSGGEPTLYDKDIGMIIKECRKNKINTAIETCGYYEQDKITGILMDIDLIIFDIKIHDNKKHRKYTGKDNQKILKNLTDISKIHKNIWIRIPLLNGVNTDREEIKNIAETINKLDNIKKIELMDYHKMGISKYQALGRKQKAQRDFKINNSLKTDIVHYYKKYLNKNNILKVA